MKRRPHLSIPTLLLLVSMPFLMQPITARGVMDRPSDAAELAAESKEPEMEEPEEMPEDLQDFTQGEGALVRKGIPWNMGPVGIVGFKNRYKGADQIRVMGVEKGAPAEGKVKPGDVILGLNGVHFDAGKDINRLVGDAIIKAEEEASDGKLVLNMWRDRNWSDRMEAQNQAAVDLDEVFKDVMATENELYLWQSEDERTEAVKTMRLGNNPVDPVTFDVEVQLEVMGTYSDTSPWDCPVATKIRENALKIISARLGKERRGGARYSALARCAGAAGVRKARVRGAGEAVGAFTETATGYGRSR